MEVNSEQENWLDAFNDPDRGLYTLLSGLSLSDINGDGDNKLVIADLGNGIKGMKLKVIIKYEHG